MAEFEIKPGRVLVAVNMGRGYERHNDPQAAFSFLEMQRERLYDELLGQTRKLQGSSVDVHQISPTTVRLVIGRALEETQTKIHILREMVATAEVEIAFLEGRDMTEIDSQVKGKYPIWL